ncbi:MAG: FHA domain-containing protein [Deltaproteobacteria bacterium]|nr:FHA domain-containing protein [Deltaproteobacteria bacterium]
MAFSLKIISGAEEGRSFDFDRIEVTIGRTMDNDVVLADPGISRQHLSIRNKGGAYILRDLGSSNGTVLNGKRVQEEVLKPGDVIELGGARVRFEPGDSAAAPRPERPARQRGGAARRSARDRPARGASPRADRAAGRGRSRAAARAERGQAPQGRGRAKPDKPDKPVIRSDGIRRRDEPKPERVESSVRARPGKKGLVGLVERGKFWFLGLDKKKKILVSSGAGLVLLLLISVAFSGTKKVVQSYSWYDEDMFTCGLTVGNRPQFYGVGDVDVQCKSRVAFSFPFSSGRATVKYQVGGINHKKEVELRLNEENVRYMDPTLQGMSDVEQISLPRKHLVENSVNQIEFNNVVNKLNPAQLDDWMVACIEIKEDPIPPPDTDKAKEHFEKCKKLKANLNVAPQNAYNAMAQCALSRDYLEQLPEDSRPSTYTEASEIINEMNKLINDRFRQMKFRAEQMEQYRRREEACDMYRQILLTIPDQHDPRYVEARDSYERLGCV